MVNAASETAQVDRRERTRSGIAEAVPVALGAANLNPFGDLNTVQHLSARLARLIKPMFETLLKRELRVWAEPLVVQRFADYRAERPEGLTGWMPMAMSPAQGRALMVVDAHLVLETLDLFFGGNGAVPAHLPAEFSPAAAAMIGRIAGGIADPARAAWAPLAHITFTPGAAETNPANLPGHDAGEAMIVTRFGMAHGEAKPAFIDLLYPIAALKPHGASLSGKALARATAPDPAWRNGLTRAVMAVKLPVRSVLAEPVMTLGRLMALKAGDIIPIAIAPHVDVMVGDDRIGSGTVGISNGFSAIRLHGLARIQEEET